MTSLRTSLLKLLYQIQRLLLRSCRFTSMAVSTLLFISGQAAMAGLADQDRRSGYSFPPGNVAPCPGPSCSHHYSNPTLTNHIREMEARQRQQIDDDRRKLEQMSKESSARSQAMMNDHLNRIDDQNRILNQQIDRTIRMAAAGVYPLWESSPAEVMGIYTMKGWNDKGPVVMTGKAGNFKVPVVVASLKGGGREALLHYEAFYGQLRFIRFALKKGKEGDIFTVSPERSKKAIENIRVVTERVPQQPTQYRVNLSAELKKGKECIIVLPDPDYQSLKHAVHIIYYIP